MNIGENKYISLTTFTKDGRKKKCPVWIVNLREREVGFTTESSSWKAKRILNNPNVELVASNSRGEPLDGAEVVKGTAHLTFGKEFESVQKNIKKNMEFNLF